MRKHGLRLVLVLALVGSVGLIVAGPAQAGKKKISSTVNLEALSLEAGSIDGTVASKASGCLAKRSFAVIDEGLTQVAVGKSDDNGEFSLGFPGATGDYSVVMSKKKLSRRKICLGDSAILDMTQADTTSTNTFDPQTNIFSGTYSSVRPACKNNRVVQLYVSHDGGNQDFTLVDESTTDSSGAWEFSLQDVPENGNWDVYAPEEIMTPGDPDVGTGDLDVTVCNEFDSPDVVITT